MAVHGIRHPGPLLAYYVEPPFLSSSSTLGHCHCRSFALYLTERKKDKGALSPFKNTALNLHIQFLFICHWRALSVIAKTPSKGVWEMWNLFQMVTHPTENQGLCHIEEEEEKHYEATSSLYIASIFTDNPTSAYSHNRLTSHMPIFQLYSGLFP